MSKSMYTETCVLPSKGLLNPEIPNGEVTIRCITIADQKFLAGTNLSGDLIVQELLLRCVEEPKGFDPSKLTNIDSFYLIVKLRNLSYGGKYSFITKCPECGKKTEVTLNLADLTVDFLDEDYEDSMYVKLPHREDTVYTRLLTNEDEREITREAKRISKKFKDSIGDPEVTLRLAKSITRIELTEPNSVGDTVLENSVDIQKYVEELTDLDATAISSVTPTYGIQTSVETVCQECREDVEVSIRFTPQFFRPKYGSSNR